MDTLIWAGTTAFGVVAWALRLEGKVNAEQQSREALKEKVIEGQQSIKELIHVQLEDISARLGRIERGMNGHLPKD